MAAIIVRTGGQTGVDRAALDHAIATNIPYCGWCPNGGWAEDFPQAPGLLSTYPDLIATPSRLPKQRTAWNTRDSHATLIILHGSSFAESPGSKFTQHMATLVFMKPCWVIDAASPRQVQAAQNWLHHLTAALTPNLLTLNIAGPRASEAPEIYSEARRILQQLLPLA